MNIQRKPAQHGKVVSGGRLQLPADFRREMGIGDGDVVVMEMKEGALMVTPYREVLERVRERLRPYAPKDGTLVSDQLIADRRAEAKRE